MTKHRKVVAFIFCRGGSKRLPGKNIMPLDGKPLLAHSIEFALDCPMIDDVVVSTEDSHIRNLALKYGAKAPFLRPAELAGDTVPEILAWRHAVQYYEKEIGKIDIFLNLPAVSPLRDQKEVYKIIQKSELENFDFVVSAVKSEANPYFNLVEVGKSGNANLCFPEGKTLRSQEVKEVFQIIPMYFACKKEIVFSHNTLFDGTLGIFEVPRARAVDVDTKEDFDYLKFLYYRYNSNFP